MAKRGADRGVGERGIRRHLTLITSAIVELCGIVAIVHALFLWSPIAGWVGVGLGGLVVGLAIDPPQWPWQKRRSPYGIDEL